MLRLFWAYVFAILPLRLKRPVGRMLWGWDIDPTARIGISVIRVRRLTMGPGTFIGGRNVITDLDELRMARRSSIGVRNRITGWWWSRDPAQQLPDRQPVLILGEGASISADHYLDCVDRIELGDYAAIGGFRCTVLTHTLDLMRDRYTSAAVEFAHHAAVLSGCTVMPGTSLPNRSIVSAGSVVTTRLTSELTFYRGNPAEPVRTLPPTLGYFRRGETRDLPATDDAGREVS